MNKRFLIAFIALILPTYAWAVSENIKELCIDDYLTFCNQFDLGTQELSTCMRNSVDQLSEGCRNALKSEGYKNETEPLKEEPQISEESISNKEEIKAKLPAEKKIVKNTKKAKNSSVVKLASQSSRTKSLTKKSKTVEASYPKGLEIPRSVGSSISVYGRN